MLLSYNAVRNNLCVKLNLFFSAAAAAVFVDDVILTKPSQTASCQCDRFAAVATTTIVASNLAYLIFSYVTTDSIF